MHVSTVVHEYGMNLVAEGWVADEEDMYVYTEVFFEKAIPLEEWRKHTIDYSHWLPFAYFMFECLMNKIRMPWHHCFLTLILTLLFLFGSYIG